MQIKLMYLNCLKLIHEFKQIEKNLRQQLYEIGLVAVELKKSGRVAENLTIDYIKKQKKYLESECYKIKVLYQSLEKIIKLYRNTERDIADNFDIGFRRIPIQIARFSNLNKLGNLAGPLFDVDYNTANRRSNADNG